MSADKSAVIAETAVEGRPARAGRPAHVRGPAPIGHARETGDRRLGYLLAAPVVILLLAITAYPLAYNLWNSFHFENLSYGGLPHKFVGWANFTQMVKSAQWVAALQRTLVFTVVTIVFDMVVGLGL